jgi:hypothetical protein
MASTSNTGTPASPSQTKEDTRLERQSKFLFYTASDRFNYVLDHADYKSGAFNGRITVNSGHIETPTQPSSPTTRIQKTLKLSAQHPDEQERIDKQCHIRIAALQRHVSYGFEITKGIDR